MKKNKSLLFSVAILILLLSGCTSTPTNEVTDIKEFDCFTEQVLIPESSNFSYKNDEKLHSHYYKLQNVGLYYMPPEKTYEGKYGGWYICLAQYHIGFLKAGYALELPYYEEFNVKKRQSLMNLEKGAYRVQKRTLER